MLLSINFVKQLPQLRVIRPKSNLLAYIGISNQPFGSCHLFKLLIDSLTHINAPFPAALFVLSASILNYRLGLAS